MGGLPIRHLDGHAMVVGEKGRELNVTRRRVWHAAIADRCIDRGAAAPARSCPAMGAPMTRLAGYVGMLVVAVARTGGRAGQSSQRRDSKEASRGA